MNSETINKLWIFQLTVAIVSWPALIGTDLIIHNEVQPISYIAVGAATFVAVVFNPMTRFFWDKWTGNNE